MLNRSSASSSELSTYWKDKLRRPKDEHNIQPKAARTTSRLVRSSQDLKTFLPDPSTSSFKHSTWSRSIRMYRLYCTPRSTSSPECSSAQPPCPWPWSWWSHITQNHNETFSKLEGFESQRWKWRQRSSETAELLDSMAESFTEVLNYHHQNSEAS